MKRFVPSENTFSLLIKASEEAAEVSLVVVEAFFGLLNPSNHPKQALFFHPNTSRFNPIHAPNRQVVESVITPTKYHLVIYLSINTAFYLHRPPTAALDGSTIASVSSLTLKSIRLHHQSMLATHSHKSSLFMDSPQRTRRCKLEQPRIDAPRMKDVGTRQPPDPRP